MQSKSYTDGHVFLGFIVSAPRSGPKHECIRGLGDEIQWQGVKVAVLDNGIDMGHPDLMGNYVSCYAYHDCLRKFISGDIFRVNRHFGK